MAGHKKICAKCGEPCVQRQGYMGIKPDKFPRYKWLHFACRDELGGEAESRAWLLVKFQAEGFKGERI